MNDPGYDEPLKEMNDEVEDQMSDEEKKKRHDKTTNAEEDGKSDGKLEEGKKEVEEVAPSRYWLMSTAAPLTAATLAPIANVMSICALVYPWRVFVPPGGFEETGQRINDPKWCLALNGISLVSGVFANIILLLNLAKRVSPTWAQPVNISLWYLSSILLVILTILYSSTSLYLTPRSTHAHSQAFYYGIIAAFLYAFISTLLVVNLVGSMMGKYNRHFKLTVAQRTLMLQTMALMMWICLGAGVFAALEGWTYLDAIYYADVTLLTVGMGDFTPSTNAGRALLFPYASIGIVTLGLVVGSIRGLVVERGKLKVKRRMLEKERAAIVGPDAKGSNELVKAAHNQEKSSEDQFEIMRIIQKKANDRRKWMSLSISTSCFAFFWLMGAFVFYKAENKNQGWTYFQSLYFAFTSLLTIGYGDFTPQSNAGRPFFVIWSLMAVPTLTILISNMGDTIIAGIKDFTLWLGEWTILPEERSLKSALQSGRKGIKWVTKSPAKATAIRNKQKAKDGKDDEESDGEGGEHQPEENLQEEAQDLVDAEDSGDEPSSTKSSQSKTETKRNKNLHHRLALAIQKLLPDLVSTPPKQYSYDEWSEYLELINMPDGNDAEEDDDKGNGEKKTVGETDWLAEDSPLMSRSTETEWLVKRMCERLEECLREKKREEGKDPDEVKTSRRTSSASSSKQGKGKKRQGEEASADEEEEKTKRKDKLRQKLHQHGHGRRKSQEGKRSGLDKKDSDLDTQKVSDDAESHQLDEDREE